MISIRFALNPGFSRISMLFMALGGEVGVRRRRRATIVCIMLIVIGTVHQVEAGTWTRKADMPTARFLARSAVVDGKIYVIGGSPVPQWGQTAVVEEYDPATDTWTRRAYMPTARRGVAAAAVDGIIYVIGGARPGRRFSTVEAYDAATDKWDTKADMPTARSTAAAAAVDGIIYVIGGWGDNGRVFSAVEAYDPATDRWIKKADMPTARTYPAACVVDGRIYVFGGNASFDLPEILPTVEVYDPATDTWTQAPDMPRVRNHHTASVVDGKMYIIGGCRGMPEDEDGEFMSSVVDVYDPAMDTWTTAADFPTPRWEPTANAVDGKIYTFGGRVGEVADYPNNLSPVSVVEEYDPGLPRPLTSVSAAEKLLDTWGRVKGQ